MNKSLLLSLFILSCFYNNAQAQHKISVYGGWTASQLQNYKTPHQYPEVSAVLHMPYLGFEYEYDWKKLRLSTGLSVSTIGKSVSKEKQLAVGSMYVNLPIIGGIQFDLAKNWGLTIESGVELGLELSSVSVYFTIADYNNKTKGNINGILALETQWKAFRLGTRLQIGLTQYRPWRTISDDRHAAITTYLGYTIWDSQIAKTKRAKKLSAMFF